MKTTTLQQIAEALGMSRQAVAKRAESQAWPFEVEAARGGQRKVYALDTLPEPVRLAWIARFGSDEAGDDEGAEAATYDRAALWAWAETRREKHRAEGAQRAELLQQVRRLMINGAAFRNAADVVASANTVTAASLRNWYYGTNGKPGAKDYDPADWAAVLIPGYTGRTATAEISPEAWEMFKGLYLVRQQPALTTCYRRTKAAAAAHGWTWPSLGAVRRKLANEFTRAELIYLREGSEALGRTMPAQTRDRSIFTAMQAINGDGIKFKPHCLWPDGQIARPHVWIWQDLYSGRLLTWRADVSENRDMLRLAFGELVEQFGIPQIAYIDNTTAAANKWLTAGVRNRYRWKIRDDDPIGIMPQMGVDVRFVTPGHGQAKPIERANRDLRELIDRHPAFAKRGTQSNPIPIDDFLKILKNEIAAHNAQQGRTAPVCAGRSFDQVFAESYARTTVRKATQEQRRLWMLAAERIRAHKHDGSLVLGRGPQGENRYWCEALAGFAGNDLIVRFDPARLHESIHAYTLDGRYIGEALCTWRAGFNDTSTGRAYHRARNQYNKHVKRAAQAKRRMTAAQAASLIPTSEPTPPPGSQVVGLDFRSRANPTHAIEATNDDEADDLFSAGIAQLRAGNKEIL